MNLKVGGPRIALLAVMLLNWGSLSAEGVTQSSSMASLLRDAATSPKMENPEVVRHLAAEAAQRDLDPKVNGSVHDIRATTVTTEGGGPRVPKPVSVRRDF